MVFLYVVKTNKQINILIKANAVNISIIELKHYRFYIIHFCSLMQNRLNADNIPHIPIYHNYSETILSGQPKKRRLPPYIFQAFYLAQPKGLCGNYRHFPAKRF